MSFGSHSVGSRGYGGTIRSVIANVLTQRLRQEAFLSHTSEIFLVLLTIAHDDINPSIRVVNNTVNITSNDNVFTAFPFEIELPDSREEAAPRARLKIGNVTREVAEALRTIQSAATITIQVIRAADPDTIEKTWQPFTMRNVEWDINVVSADLLLEEIDIEPVPLHKFTPGFFPGLF